MKTSQLRKELEKHSKDKLLKVLNDYQRELFSLNFNAATTHIKDYSQFKKSRKNIARVLTVLQQKLSDQKVKNI